MSGTDITIVTYKGTGPLTTDLLGGHVMLAFNTLPPAIGNIKAGKLRAIAVAAPVRLAAIPDVPTTAETGLPGLEIVQYYGLVAPAGTPPPIIDAAQQGAAQDRDLRGRQEAHHRRRRRSASPARRTNMPPTSSARKASGRR